MMLLSGDKTIYILSVTHGFPDGTLQAETRFFDEDVQNFAGRSEVTAHDISVMAQDEIEVVPRNSGTIIVGFCNSEDWLIKFVTSTKWA